MGFPSDTTSRNSSLDRLNVAHRAIARRRKSTTSALRLAAGGAVEALEGRRLLAVVNAGEFAYFYNGANSYKITVEGSGSFTFTAAVHPAMGGGVSLEEVPMTVFGRAGGPVDYAGGYQTTLPAGSANTALPAFDIYSILSSDTSADSSLAITQYTPATATTRGFSTPFADNGGSFITQMVDPGQQSPVTVAAGNGGVFIGARQNFNNTPVSLVTSLTRNASIAVGPGVVLPRNQDLLPGIFINGSVNNLFIGGTITGKVDVSGSANTFYAGNVITGDPTNGNLTNVIGARNFSFGGDLRNLIVDGGVGTVSGAPNNFIPGTDVYVGGRVQQIKAGLEFRASLEVGGGTGKYTDGSDLVELETRDITNVTAASVGDSFDSFQLVNRGVANNDSFARPQILGSYESDDRGIDDQVTLTGSINNGDRFNDNADYYGVPLIAGQAINIQSVSTFGDAYVAVFDPDNRLVATDRSNQNNASFQGQSFRFTPTTAGLFRVAILPVSPTQRINAPRPYTLTLDRLGDVAIGGVTTGTSGTTGGDIYLTQAGSETPSVGLRARRNDIGAILAAGDLYGASSADANGATGREAVLDNPIIANRGNIRSVSAANISRLINGRYGLIPNIVASRTVGRVMADGYLYINDSGLNSSNLQPSNNLTTGGDWQVIQAGGDFSGNISVGGGIGVIRAGSVAARIQNLPGYFEMDADSSGRDGFIGLIDVANDLGTFRYGGPAISAGANSVGSNVRFMRVGGTVYRDAGAGAGQNNVISSSRTVQITDDSGAIVSITPILGEDFDNTPDTTTGSNGDDPTTGTPVDDGVIGTGSGGNPIGTNPDMPGSPIGTNNGSPFLPTLPGNGGIADPVVTPPDTRPRTSTGRVVGGTLTISTYPTRLGGSVIFRVEASDPSPDDPQSIGVEISTSGSTGADIGEIVANSFGTAVVSDPDPLDNNSQPTKQTPLQLALTGSNKEVIITGARTGVFDIHGANGGTDFTQIFNATDGEIVNVEAGSVVALEAEYLGVARPSGGVQLDGFANAAAGANVYPFNQTKNLINVDNALSIVARGPIGNVLANDVQLLEANGDNRNVKGTFEGIVAPIVATTSFRRVDIGEGLANSGTGETSFGGIYSSDTIGLVSNDNGNGDLQGDVIAGRYIEGIRLNGDASILNADILESGTGQTQNDDGTTTDTGFRVGLETNSFLINANTSTGLDGIGDIRVLGTGGIINTRVLAQNMGTTTVAPSGFGTLNSTFFSSGGGTMKGLISGGLGIRNTQYTGGASIGDVVATGGGELLDLNKFTRSVRGSQGGYYEYQTGQSFNAANDVYLTIGTSPADSTVVGVTNSGIISDSSIIASTSISSVRAFDFRSFDTNSLRPSDELFPNTINFANSIGAIAAKRNIDGLRVVGGQLGTFSAGGSVSNTRVQVRADLGEVIVKKNILGTTSFNVTTGSIGSFRVGGNMNGTIFTDRGIGSIIIDGDVRSARDQGGIYTTGDIGQVKIGGVVKDGSYIRARKSLKSLTLNGDFQSGAIIRAARFGAVRIRGSNEGTLQEN